MKKFLMVAYVFLMACTNNQPTNINLSESHNEGINQSENTKISNDLSKLSLHDKAIRDSYDELIVGRMQYSQEEFSKKARELIDKAKTVENKEQREFILMQLYIHTNFDDAYHYNESLLKDKPNDIGLLVARCSLQEIRQVASDEIRQCYQKVQVMIEPLVNKLMVNDDNYYQDNLNYYIISYKAGNRNARQQAEVFFDKMPDAQKKQYEAMMIGLE